jgi:hypothetical protein
MEIGRIFLLSEPALEFRHAQRTADPHVGLSPFGPWDANSDAPGRIIHGVIGTPQGIEHFERFAEAVAGPVISTGADEAPRDDLKAELKRIKRSRVWPAFPGFEAAFVARWNSAPAFTAPIDADVLEQTNRQKDDHRRVHAVVDLFLDPLRVANEKDNPPKVVVCVVPDGVWLNCRPNSRVSDGIGIRPSSKEQALRRRMADLFEDYAPQEYDYSTDFRRQLKARALTHCVPIQIVRESTLLLDPDETARTLTCSSDRAWNLAAALYYKAGGKPWRLASARPGVCYIGLAFKREHPGSLNSRNAVCAAQMFLDTGDGVVFRGEMGPWYSPDNRQYRVGRKEARSLLEGVLAAYREQDGRPLREVFLHCHSEIGQEDFEGYAEACPADARIVAIRVRRADNTARLYRAGKYPVVRGTIWTLNERTAFLWTHGFKPHLLTYDGWMVPAPLQLDIQHGEADIQQVAADILGLTKLNYNACRAGDAMPVTVKFSRMVGDILVSNPTVKERQPNFKYYI